MYSQMLVMTEEIWETNCQKGGLAPFLLNSVTEILMMSLIPPVTSFYLSFSISFSDSVHLDLAFCVSIICFLANLIRASWGKVLAFHSPGRLRVKYSLLLRLPGPRGGRGRQPVLETVRHSHLPTVAPWSAAQQPSDTATTPTFSVSEITKE